MKWNIIKSLNQVKNFLWLVPSVVLCACGAQNNITFSTQQGNCADGSVNAPYCMGITIQNNESGQNWITNTSYPISSLQLTVTSSAANVGYPTSSGSNFDPNNCLGSSIGPGSSCTFYLQLSGESAAVGTKPPVTINASYTVNNSLLGGGTSTNNSSVTVYETPATLITGNNGWVQSYNANGISSSFQAESGEASANAVANDNYYGYLYVAGNTGIYYSGNGYYTGNATQSSSSIRGATNLALNGQTIYATPNGSLASNVYSAGVLNESFSWGSYASGLINITSNVNALNGSRLFYAQSSAANVYMCTQNSTGNNCNLEGPTIPNSATINTLVMGNPANSLTGLIAGTNTGIYLESGIFGLPSNQWMPAVYPGGVALSNVSIVHSATDNNLNAYFVDSTNIFYELPVNASTPGELTVLTTWMLPPGQAVSAMAYDNTGGQMFVVTQSGALYACLANHGLCNPLPSSTLGAIPLSLNIITSLTSS